MENIPLKNVQDLSNIELLNIQECICREFVRRLAKAESKEDDIAINVWSIPHGYC